MRKRKEEERVKVRDRQWTVDFGLRALDFRLLTPDPRLTTVDWFSHPSLFTIHHQAFRFGCRLEPLIEARKRDIQASPIL